MKRSVLCVSIFFLILWTCKRVKTMEQSVVSIIPFEKLEANHEDVKNFSYCYNKGLYISNPKVGIVGIRGNNVFLTIGKKTREYNLPDRLSWENRFIEFLENIGNENVNRSSERFEKPVFIEYRFSKVGKIAVSDDSIFVEHIKNDGKEILKFSKDGKFLYRLGRDGRDDPNLFSLDASIIEMYVNKEDSLWVKYVYSGMICLKYFNRDGKNLFKFDENAINSSLTPYVSVKEGDYYQVEDIFPIMDSTNIGVIVNVYHRNANYHIKDKLYVEFNRNLSAESYWRFKRKNIVFFDITPSNDMIFFSYLPAENYNLVYVIDKDGRLVFEKKFLLRKFDAKKISLFLSFDGLLTGIYEKGDKLVVVQWK